MADTVAVMNERRDRAAGHARRSSTSTRAPRSWPTSSASPTWSAARSSGPAGDDVQVDVEGNRRPLAAAGARVAGSTERDEVWVGVRPEKVCLAAAGAERRDGANVLAGGVVTDASFVGVSTQYLARMPWGQELTVFEQNTGAAEALRASATWSTCTGCPTHTFLLDAAPGRLGRRGARGRRDEPACQARRRRPATPARACRTRRSAAAAGSAYLLLLPGRAVAAAVLRGAAVQPGRAPPSTTRPGSLELGYADDLALVSNYIDALPGLLRAVPPLARCTPALATVFCILLGYPLAYAIAFKAGRWKNLMLVAGDRAVLHQLPDPHARLEADPGRQRASSWTSLQYAAHPRRRRPPAGHAGRGGHRPHLQLPAVHGAAALRAAWRRSTRG